MILIFDMDGVIVDNHRWHFEAWIEFGKRHQISISKEEFSRHFGSTNQLIMTSLFGDSITDEEIIRLSNEKESIYRELYLPYIKPVQGLPSFLAFAYNRGICMAIASSAPKENVNFTLHATGLEKYFSLITDSSMVRFSKPDPEIYLVTAEKLGVQPSECIVFEDSIAGILSAKNAGMIVIGVATTHNKKELTRFVNEIILNFDDPEILYEKLLSISINK